MVCFFGVAQVAVAQGLPDVGAYGDPDAGIFEVMAIGAPFNDQSGTNAGRVSLHTQSLPTSPVWSTDAVLGESPNDRFGAAVAVADFNGDGRQDVAVGAPQLDLGGTPFGRVYIYFSHEHIASWNLLINDTPSATLTSPNANAKFGETLAAGDLNGDGRADLIVGAPDDNTAAAQAGRVYVYFGVSGAFDTTADATLNGGQAFEHFGLSLASRADFDGDGYDELAVGAPYFDVSFFSLMADAGRVYVYRGATTFPGAGGWPIYGTAANDRFGKSVALARSINGDAYGDLIVGVPYKDSGANADAGRAYVYFGPVFTPLAGTLSGGAANDYFGAAVTSADMNRDGFEDVVIGAEGNDDGGAEAGKVFVYYGASGATLDNVPDLSFTGPAGSRFGSALANATKLDPPRTLIVGAHTWSGPANGAVFIYGAATSPISVTELHGAAAGDWFGWSVAGH